MNYIYQLIAWALPTSTVDRAVSIIIKAAETLAAETLAAVEAKQNSRVAAIDDQINTLIDARAVASAEASRAGRVAENLAAITV